MPFDRIGIVGLGLLGGSLARGLKGLPSAPTIRAQTLDQDDLEAALEAGVVDDSPAGSGDFFEDLDLVVYCTPLNATLSLLEQHRDFLSPRTVITDVVSLKAPVLDKVRSLDLHHSFVGSHPMAGSEKTGFAASKEGLFLDARVWLVAHGAPRETLERLELLWASLGGHPALIEASEHDTLMAWISHLPQLTANALSAALGKAGFTRAQLGPGGKDMTRLAGSGPNMWRDLLEHAPEALLSALGEVERNLSEIRASLTRKEWDDVETRMRETRAWSKGEPWS